MELATLIGLIIGWGVMILANSLEGGHLSSLWQYTAFLIVVGGTLGAAFISFPLQDMLNLPKLIALTFQRSPHDPAALIPQLSTYADKARREGLLALETELAGTDDAFMRKGLQMVADGIDPHTVRELLETELTFIASRHAASFGILEAMGGYAPTMGIIGTVMGLIHVLGNLSEPSKLGSAIAVAFVATLYGVWTANLLWLPLATKLKRRSEEEILAREMMVAGILAIQAGENPQIVEDKLKGFISPKQRGSLKLEEAVK
jgi:chemotaxis protein MotA